MRKAARPVQRPGTFFICLLVVVASCSRNDGTEPYAFLLKKEENKEYTIDTLIFFKKTCLAAEGVWPTDDRIKENFGVPNDIVRTYYIDQSSGYWTLIVKDHDDVVRVISVPQISVRWEPFGNPDSVLYYEYQKFICKRILAVQPIIDECVASAPCFEIE
jgi:hypothetical protein